MALTRRTTSSHGSEQKVGPLEVTKGRRYTVTKNERISIGQKGANARGEASSVINLMNDYGAEIVKANAEAATILKASWGWLDAEDMAIVGDFLVHVERRQLEHGRDVPFELFVDKDGKLDAPTVYDPTFVDKVRDKLRAKQVELSGPP